MEEKRKSTDKVFMIQSALAQGEKREAIAKKLGYGNWKSLDIFMRRKGMKWDAENNNYYAEQPMAAEFKKVPDISSSKVKKIISMFGQGNADPINISKKLGFGDHHEMASYMKARGYNWSPDVNNYVLQHPQKQLQEMAETEFLEPEEDTNIKQTYLSKYVPILETLLKNKDKIFDIFSQNQSSIPRYIVPGVTRTKSFYISDSLSRLICEFSQTKNVSQKEIIETAVIEFLCKYSFEKEVNQLLWRTTG